MKAVFLGYSCNNSCVFCAQGALRASAPPTADADIAQVLRGARQIAFQGGEPTLREDLPALIKRAKDGGASWVLLQTNGRRLVYPDYVRSLREAGLDACEVALQGSTAPMHDYHTGVPGGWLQTVGGLKRLRAARIPFGASVVVTRSNFRHLTDVVALAAELGAAALRFRPAEPAGKALAARDRVVPSAAMFEPFLEQALTRAKDLKLPAFAGEPTGKSRRLFAGLGPLEPPPPVERKTSAEEFSRRPKPALKEVRGASKRTGADLKEIFPALFEPGGGA